MKKYYELDLASPGAPGDRSITDGETYSKVYHSLHVLLEGWLGDELVHTYPCFLVSDSLGAKLLAAGFTGFELGVVEVEKEMQFDFSHPGVQLPHFQWMKITGKRGVDDFFLTAEYWLVASEEALNLILTAEVPSLSADEYLI